MIAYATRTGTVRNLVALKSAGFLVKLGAVDGGEIDALTPATTVEGTAMAPGEMRVGTGDGCVPFVVEAKGDQPRSTGILCFGRKRKKKCSSCGRDASKACDYPLGGKQLGKTCDAAICAACAVSIAPEVDYCRPHVDVASR